MSRFLFSRLRVRLIVLVLLGVIPALGLILSTAAWQRHLIVLNVQTELLRLARLAAVDHKQFLGEARQLLVTLSQLPELHEGDPTACQALLSKFLKRFPFYTNLGAADLGGYVFCSALPVQGESNLVDRAYVQQVLQANNFAISEYQIDQASAKTSLSVGYPLLDAAGGATGVVFTMMDLTWFNRLAAEAQLPEGTVLVVMNRRGTILAHYPHQERWVGRSVSDAPLMQTILARGDGVAEVPGFDGRSSLYAFTALESAVGAGVYVSVGIPRSLMFAKANHMFVQHLIWLGLVGLLALGAAWVGGDVFVLRQVNALVNATKRVATGDLGARTGLKYGQGELDHLARNFDEMAATLQRRQAEAKLAAEALRRAHDELELQVQERTAQLRTANRRLEELSALKDEFVSNVNHELRSPLIAVKGGVNLMLEKALGPINDEQRDFLQTVDHNINRLTALINDMLDLSKIEAGRVELVRRRLSLQQLIETTLKTYKALAGTRTLSVELSPVPEVFADPNRILQVLGNLFSNAVKFTQEDGTITCMVQPREGVAEVSVRDDGIGIAQEDLSKLFQKFSQVGRSDTRSQGTGLGLVLCKQLVELHKGTMTVTSEPGHGSTFTFTLPLYSPRFVLEDSFQELMASAKQDRHETVAVLALDAKPFLAPLPAGPSKPPTERLEQIAELLRKQVHQDEVVLSIEPQWVVVLSVTEPRDVHGIVQRLRVALTKDAASLGEGADPLHASLGVAVYPSDGEDVQSLFAKATTSLNQGLAAVPTVVV